MRLACRHESSHNAVKLLWPRVAWHAQTYARHVHISPSASRKQHQIPFSPRLDPQYLLGSYKPSPAPNPQARNIAVLGGGITGLATAFHLSRDIPHAKITIFETKDKLGGWVDSEQVEVDNGTVMFEWGPRTLRPDLNGNGKATLQLINMLPRDKSAPQSNFIQSIRGIPLWHPAASNRFVYYPDHLVRMPAPSPQSGLISNLFSNISTILTEPIFSGLVSRLIAEPTVACRSLNQRDESIGSFVSRRFGVGAADNLLSALFHGIYAGDIYKLSARTLLPALWHLENRDQDGNGIMAEVMELFFRQHVLKSFDKVRFLNRLTTDNIGDPESFHFLLNNMRHTSVYTFRAGISQLVDAVAEVLRATNNVTIKTATQAEKLAFDPNSQKIVIQAKNSSEIEYFDYSVCTLSPTALAQMLQQSSTQSQPTDTTKSTHTPLIQSLTKGSPSAVNVCVINLYYANPDLPVPRGFGYLIPRSISLDQNPERALGVIFASETAGPRGKEAIKTVTAFDSEKLSAKLKANFPDTWEAMEKEPQNLDIRELLSEKDGEVWEEKIQAGQDTATGTKLAVMIGGHWWDGWSESDLPSEDEAIEMAKSVIARHLKITESPYLAKARMQRNCIPQYQVGYRDSMARIHQDLSKDFKGRMKVAGVWWQGGVGLNDCVRSARETSRRIRETWDEETGLEGYVGNEKWVLEDRKTGVQVMDPLAK